jgi:hypothetical protein
MGNTLAAVPRKVLLEELRGRINARVATVEKRLRLLRDEFEKLELERIELSPNSACLSTRCRSAKAKPIEYRELFTPAAVLQADRNESSLK